MVGVLLFQNAKRIDFYQPQQAVPAYCCLFFIPFTYSILRGVGFGYATFIAIGIFTGWISNISLFATVAVFIVIVFNVCGCLLFAGDFWVSFAEFLVKGHAYVVETIAWSKVGRDI